LCFTLWLYITWDLGVLFDKFKLLVLLPGTGWLTASVATRVQDSSIYVITQLLKNKCLAPFPVRGSL